MKGGCLGKILVFIFGVIVGFVLFAGTIAGAGYYLVTQVTVNDVEKVAKTEFTFIDKEAEIRDKSLYDIFKLVSGGDIKNITVKGAKSTFGIDLISIIEKSLDITIREEGRAELEDLPILQVFQGDNLKIVLNSITLNDVLTKAGIDKSTLDGKPLISDHYGDPVIDAFNAILKELDFNALKIGDMEYLVGLTLGSGILDNLKDYSVSNINSAINDITFEKILPNFDRDYYYLVQKDGAENYYVELYYEDGYEQVSFTPAYVLIADGEEIAASDRYTVGEDGVVKQDDEGIYKKDGDLPLIEDLYAKTGVNTYTQNRYGVCKVADGTPASERYIKNADNTYTQDAAGTYKKRYTTVNNGGAKYAYSYVKNFVETEEGSGVFVLEKRGLVALNDELDLATADKLIVKTTVEGEGDEAKTTNQLIVRTDETAVEYVLAHTGASERMLQALADMSLNNLNDRIGSLTIGDVIEVNDESSKILIALKDTPIDKLGDRVGTLKLSEVMTITGESSKLLQELKDTEIDNLSTAIDDLKLKSIIDIKERNIVTAAADGEYIALPALAAGKEYTGSYIEAYTSQESEDRLLLVKYIEGIDDDGKYFDGQQRYTLPAENKASSGILVSMADVTVKNLSNMEDIIMGSILGKVIDIDGDVFASTDYTTYAEVPEGLRDVAYVYFDAEGDVMRGIDATDTTATVIYEKVYSGEGNAIIKKMAGIKINDIAARTQVVIDETKLSEVITIQKDNVLVEAADGEYIELPAGTYVGSYKTGLVGDTLVNIVKYQEGIDDTGALCEGMHRYDITTASSNAVLAGMADKKIKNMTGDMQSLIDNSTLNGVIEIDGDVFMHVAYTSYGAVAAADADNLTEYFVYSDGNMDIMRTVGEDDIDTVIYKRVYTGKDSAIIKKMAGIKIVNVSSRIQAVVDETRLNEVLTVQEEYVLEENAEGAYVAIPEDKAVYGTFNTGRVDGTSEHVNFVKVNDSVITTDASNYFYGQKRYNIKTEISNGVLIKIADKKIGELTGGMQSAVDETLMSDVMDISGNAYERLNATSYAAAVIAAAGKTIYYQDASGLFLTAGYFRSETGAYVYVGDAFIAYVAADHEGLQRYTFEGEDATEFFIRIYSGSSNAILRKLATVTAKSLGTGDTMNKAVKDCSLAEVGVAPNTDDGSILFKLKDTRISEMNYAIEDVLGTATLREINEWGNLGMSATQLDALKVANGGDDIYAKDFFEGLTIGSYNPGTGEVSIVWKKKAA